jgi:hypothetical protein
MAVPPGLYGFGTGSWLRGKPFGAAPRVPSKPRYVFSLQVHPVVRRRKPYHQRPFVKAQDRLSRHVYAGGVSPRRNRRLWRQKYLLHDIDAIPHLESMIALVCGDPFHLGPRLPAPQRPLACDRLQ